MNDRKIQVGVIGTGGMGGRHARNLAHRVARAQVVAVMDVDRARAEVVADECGQARIYTDALALIADTAVEAVVIASPDPTHAGLTMACLEVGKAVLCEKPLATGVAEAEKVVKAEMAGGRRLAQVGFMREYDPAHQRVKEIVVRGDIGRPLLFKGLHVNLSTGYDRTTRDVIVNSAIHDIHSARWLLGDEVAGVYVQRVAAGEDKPESCRLLLIQLTMRNGSLTLIEANSDSGYGYEVDVEIVGQLGSARTASLRSPIVRRAGVQARSIEADWLERFETAYINEVQTWVQTLLQEGQPGGPTAWDGYISLVIADACIRSAETGHPQAVPIVERPAMYDRST
jgi:myo-inositol 2-dehydrogenase/D-chiro-inositol 1-dehydrogenase